jgi:hypothetical protein
MSIELGATICFTLAIFHTFLVKRFQHIALRFPAGSPGENIFHLLGEVEIVFGVWAGIFLTYFSVFEGHQQAVDYLQGRNFTEPVFVFVIMTVCSSRPILELSERLIGLVSRAMPFNKSVTFFWSTLVIGSLLGSFITEPAAMTVTALILLQRFYQHGISQKLMYATIGLLFVNVSIGGTLTPYAAPPLLMVAQKWNWDLAFTMGHFGWKGALAIALSTSFVAIKFRTEIAKIKWEHSKSPKQDLIPLWVSLVHCLFLVLIVASSHYMAVFLGLFMFFLGLVTVTKEYQSELKIKEGLLVAFFLGGLVVLGGQQRWWLEPVLTSLGTLPMYLGAIGLTAVTDNAALTYLGSQVPSLTEISKYALVAGSVVGGGLTVIANAPNPAGFGILNASFGEEGISPLGLFASALIPTLIAAICFGIFLV